MVKKMDKEKISMEKDAKKKGKTLNSKGSTIDDDWRDGDTRALLFSILILILFGIFIYFLITNLPCVLTWIDSAIDLMRCKYDSEC
jgi:hypothetical protein